ncbi:MAG TPA: hypothetical protein VKG67_01760 [Gallionellaceae bacterium]|nr:hypothetical protein [Gallionellaceae bacterium]
MIFKYCFAKVTFLTTGLSHQVYKWLSDSRNTHKVVPESPAGSGTYGLLVSSGAAQGRWF